MKNNQKANPLVAVQNSDMILKPNLQQSRDLAAQPLIKLNVGQGNSFIVKNSNIVI